MAAGEHLAHIRPYSRTYAPPLYGPLLAINSRFGVSAGGDAAGDKTGAADEAGTA